MSSSQNLEKTLEDYVEYFEARCKRSWGRDILVVVTMLALSVLSWSYWNEIVALGLLGSAFYYCGHGDGNRSAAKRGINILAFGVEDPWDSDT